MLKKTLLRTRVFLKYLLIVPMVLLLLNLKTVSQEVFLLDHGTLNNIHIGSPVEDTVELYKNKGYVVKKAGNSYTVSQKNSLVNLFEVDFNPNITRVNDKKYHLIIRLKTSNPKFQLKDGTQVLGMTLNELSLLYGSPTIYRQNVNSPEWVEFERNILEKLSTKNGYKVYTRFILNKNTDHLGNPTHTGKYLGDYSIFTDEYDENAYIESVEFVGTPIF